jgi:ribosomal protein S18 acetylase RimI-like enzyme
VISLLTWDSNLFNRKIGELKLVSPSESDIVDAVASARESGYDYIFCKLDHEGLWRPGLLESYGFYLSDIGTTYELNVDSLANAVNMKKALQLNDVRSATVDDIAPLKEMSGPIFWASRFYSDPFYSEEEADLLFRTWIENAVKGDAADAVFVIEDKGFISGTVSDQTTGMIDLIGVDEGARNSGVGTALVLRMATYFKDHNVHVIKVRTQLRNVDAMNFYGRLGFRIKGYDLIFSKIL